MESPCAGFGNGAGAFKAHPPERHLAPPRLKPGSQMAPATSCGEIMDIEDLRRTFAYDPETGLFARRSTGFPLLRPNNRGYIQAVYRGKKYVIHRLAFAIMTGRMPKVLDHINRNRSDNRWCNLREVTPSQNMWNRAAQANNTSGFKGVYWHTKQKKWRAKIKRFGRVIWLGDFTTAEEAALEYNKAAIELHGEYAFLNNVTQAA